MGEGQDGVHQGSQPAKAWTNPPKSDANRGSPEEVDPIPTQDPGPKNVRISVSVLFCRQRPGIRTGLKRLGRLVVGEGRNERPGLGL